MSEPEQLYIFKVETDKGTCFVKADHQSLRYIKNRIMSENIFKDIKMKFEYEKVKLTPIETLSYMVFK